ncbi:hypothetical protein HDV05_003426 [Chytridiales sp. JEL 0842]|nr:hypothetical protein HDV05_003426 [Chytridiales sp. JEL 0842]
MIDLLNPHPVVAKHWGSLQEWQRYADLLAADGVWPEGVSGDSASGSGGGGSSAGGVVVVQLLQKLRAGLGMFRTEAYERAVEARSVDGVDGVNSGSEMSLVEQLLVDLNATLILDFHPTLNHNHNYNNYNYHDNHDNHSKHSNNNHNQQHNNPNKENSNKKNSNLLENTLTFTPNAGLTTCSHASTHPATRLFTHYLHQNSDPYPTRLILFTPSQISECDLLAWIENGVFMSKPSGKMSIPELQSLIDTKNGVWIDERVAVLIGDSSSPNAKNGFVQDLEDVVKDLVPVLLSTDSIDPAAAACRSFLLNLQKRSPPSSSSSSSTGGDSDVDSGGDSGESKWSWPHFAKAFALLSQAPSPASSAWPSPIDIFLSNLPSPLPSKTHMTNLTCPEWNALLQSDQHGLLDINLPFLGVRGPQVRGVFELLELSMVLGSQQQPFSSFTPSNDEAEEEEDPFALTPSDLDQDELLFQHEEHAGSYLDPDSLRTISTLCIPCANQRNLTYTLLNTLHTRLSESFKACPKNTLACTSAKRLKSILSSLGRKQAEEGGVIPSVLVPHPFKRDSMVHSFDSCEPGSVLSISIPLSEVPLFKTPPSVSSSTTTKKKSRAKSADADADLEPLGALIHPSTPTLKITSASLRALPESADDNDASDDDAFETTLSTQNLKIHLTPDRTHLELLLFENRPLLGALSLSLQLTYRNSTSHTPLRIPLVCAPATTTTTTTTPGTFFEAVLAGAGGSLAQRSQDPTFPRFHALSFAFPEGKQFAGWALGSFYSPLGVLMGLQRVPVDFAERDGGGQSGGGGAGGDLVEVSEGCLEAAGWMAKEVRRFLNKVGITQTGGGGGVGVPSIAIFKPKLKRGGTGKLVAVNVYIQEPTAKPQVQLLLHLLQILRVTFGLPTLLTGSCDSHKACNTLRSQINTIQISPRRSFIWTPLPSTTSSPTPSSAVLTLRDLEPCVAPASSSSALLCKPLDSYAAYLRSTQPHLPQFNPTYLMRPRQTCALRLGGGVPVSYRFDKGVGRVVEILSWRVGRGGLESFVDGLEFLKKGSWGVVMLQFDEEEGVEAGVVEALMNEDGAGAGGRWVHSSRFLFAGTEDDGKKGAGLHILTRVQEKEEEGGGGRVLRPLGCAVETYASKTRNMLGCVYQLGDTSEHVILANVFDVHPGDGEGYLANPGVREGDGVMKRLYATLCARRNESVVAGGGEGGCGRYETPALFLGVWGDALTKKLGRGGYVDFRNGMEGVEEEV